MKTYKYTVVEEIYDTGTKTITYFNEHNQTHRLDGPALQVFYKDGSLKFASYCKDGKRGRIDGPSYIEYYENGKLCINQYRKNDKLHRLDGPAHEYFNENGKLKHEEYWIDGEMFSKEDFLKKTSKASCDNKVVEIEGKKYKLIEIKE